jgi:predicted metal-binding membrane protein
MGDIPMPGGWTMSAMWTPMCGQTWLGAAAAFVGMWTWMMAAMTLPLSTPNWASASRRFWAQRRSEPVPAARIIVAAQPALWLWAGIGGLLTWAAAGALVFAFGNALAECLPHLPRVARFVPLASSVLVVVAGAVQFTSWKAHQLTVCRCGDPGDPGRTRSVSAAWMRGFRAAYREGCCCANLMAVLLLVGVMDLRAMAVVAAAMVIERHVPAGGRTAHAIGIGIASTGLFMGTRAMLAL